MLTDRAVKTSPPGRHGDDTVRGLMLVVKPSGSRSWLLRYQLAGRRRDMGLGPYPEITLARAREKALQARRLVKEGVDPLSDRRRSKGLTFKVAAEALIKGRKAGWKNEKHRAQWPSTLKAYAYDKIGDLDVNLVATQDVLDCVQPIWAEKPETASRVRQRIEAVLDYAKALGVRQGDNPARWKGNLDHLLPRPGKVRQVRHHAALDWREAPSFMAELAKRPGTAAMALAFAILTAARSGEVRGMKWGEVADKTMMWVVP